MLKLTIGLIIGVIVVATLIEWLFNNVWPPTLVGYWAEPDTGNFIVVEFSRAYWPWSRYNVTFHKPFLLEVDLQSYWWCNIETGAKAKSDMLNERLTRMAMAAAALDKDDESCCH